MKLILFPQILTVWWFIKEQIHVLFPKVNFAMFSLNSIVTSSWAHYAAEGNFFYPGLDVGYDFLDHHKIYGNIAKVNRIPTFTDLYYVSRTEAGNPLLKPEHALSAELGYRFQKSNFLGKISGFMRNSDDSIDWVKQNANDIWRAENIGQIYTKGIEVEISQNFGSVLKSYSVGYTFLDSKSSQPLNLISRYVMENLKHRYYFRCAYFGKFQVCSGCIHTYPALSASINLIAI